MNDDAELLRRYAIEHSEAAFAELVRRHVDLVYSAALRLVNGDAHRAQDISQQVFTEFARQAKHLARHPAPVGWLYTTTRRSALRVIRTEQRRSAREQEATTMNELVRESTADSEWEQLRPVLEDAMDELGEKDRHAVLLRFFQNKSLRDVGLALDMGENAARMRVERALEKLRAGFAKRGVAAGTTLAAIISTHAVQMAPAGLAATLTTASLAGVGTGAGALTLLKIMTATQFKLGVGAVIVAGISTVLVMQHQAQTRLADDNQALRQQIDRLENVVSKTTNTVGAAVDASSQTKDQLNELLKLRGEVAVLRRQLDMEKTQAAQTAAASNGVGPSRLPGNGFVARGNMADVGFDTPEAALQTWMHGILTTNYEATMNAMVSQIQAEVAKDPKQKEDFEKSISRGVATTLLGQEIVAKKILSDDQVELEVLVYTDGAAPEISVQRMKKEGDQWKFGGSRGFTADWGKSGQIQNVGPFAGQ